MSCPFFMPTERFAVTLWRHPQRLPLGGGWTGHCTAPGHEGARPSDDELRDCCNLGYGRCGRVPARRPADAVRFSVVSDRAQRILVCFVCEAAHRPAQQGMLEYDLTARAWRSPHPDPRIQRQAECYLESYLARRGEPRSPQPAR